MALLGAVAALYVPGLLTTFSQISLTGDVTHKIYTAAVGNRKWKAGETFLIEKQIHGANEWIDITSLCMFDYVMGRITLASALNSDDLVRASGKRVPDLEDILTVFSQIALTGDVTHKIYTASFAARYWKEGETFLIEKRVHNEGDWVDITEDCTFNYLAGRIALEDALNSDDVVRASGKRVPVVKLAEMLGYSLKGNRDKVEVTNSDSGMWKEFLPDHKANTATAKKWNTFDADAFSLYDNVTVPLMIVCFIEDGTSKKNFAAFGFLEGFDPTKDIKDAQAEDLSVQFSGELIWETNA